MRPSIHHLQKIMSSFVIIAILTLAVGSAKAVDIGPMSWTQRGDWINVKSCSSITGGPNAVGNGSADDTAALQAVFNYLQNHENDVTAPQYVTVYFPAGTYIISSTLLLASTQQFNCQGYTLIGCGSNTTLKWAGTAPIGPAMFAPDGTDHMRYIGFVWDGNNRAGCGVEHNTIGRLSGVPTYESQILHENESFKNFTAYGNYIPGESLPGAGIAQGFRTDINPPHTGNPTSEVMVYNCSFNHCAIGIGTTMTGAGNYYMWNVDGCEFENCGNGCYFPGAGGYMVTNCHFQNSSGADLYGGLSRIRHCTSSGSSTFYTEGGGFADPNVIQDCWVDRWKTAGPAVTFQTIGPSTVYDCSFTNPPTGATGAIHYNWGPQPPLYGSLILSNNYAPNFSSGYGIVDSSSTATCHDVIPAGKRGGMVSSAAQTFLLPTWPADSANIIDVTQSPYTADRFGGGDATSTIQAAINAAKAANNSSVVYIPAGIYKISSTLTASGSNYTIQGSGIRSELKWYGAANTPILSISTPQNMAIQALDFNDQYSDLIETATGPSSISFDDVHGIYNGYRGSLIGQGIVLSNLPAGSTVSLGHVDAPLTVANCGAAQILAKFLQFSTINVSGTSPKTGFLGFAIGEGGQQGAGQYNITINDNQDLVIGDYYTEQQSNDLDIERGAGTVTGHVAIQGVNSAATGTQTSIKANNYAGRLFYDAFTLANNIQSPVPVQITQIGSNALDMLFAGTVFNYSQPTITHETGANIVQADGLVNDSPQYFANIADSPNPLTAANLTSLSAGYDDLRQLEAANAAQQAGLVAYWKLDDITGGISKDSSISGLDGIWMNGPTFSATHPASLLFTDPGSLSFNGVNQYVNAGLAASLPSGTAARTICGWAKANSLAAGYRWMASFGSTNNNQAMFLGMNGTALYAGGWGADFSVPDFWDTNWHFIALTYDGTTANLYGDGVLRATVPESWNLVPGTCSIGQMLNNNSGYWNGQLDDVRIYNRALSSADVVALAGTTVITSPPAGTPYGGTAWAVPGKIEAENYNLGGQNVAYYDTTSGNTGGAYRSDDVDIRSSSDIGGGYQVGWTGVGDWTNYTINVAATGTYNFQIRTSCGVAGGLLHIDMDGSNVTGSVSIPNTGGWDTFTTLTANGISLTAGQHVMRVYFDAGGPDLNWINIVSANIEAPYGGTPWPIPGQIEAENYDLGGQNVGYYDATAGNAGHAYRFDDVDLKSCSDTGNGYEVGWTETGDWMKYTVNVTSAGHYTFQARVASGQTGGVIHMEVDGVNVTGSVSIPNTGDWTTTFTTLTTGTGIALTAGQHVIRLVVDTGSYGPEINWLNFIRTGS